MAKPNQILAEYGTEWRRSRKKLSLRKALVFCQEHKLPEPLWLHEALYQLGRGQIMKMKKTGRPTDLISDDTIYAIVEDYLEAGFTQDRAWVQTARDLWPRDSKHDRSYTVKSAWLRHKKRIVKVDPSKQPPGFECFTWRIKQKYLKNDPKVLRAAEGLPTKNR